MNRLMVNLSAGAALVALLAVLAAPAEAIPLRRLIAPESTCPAASASASVSDQEEAMLCLTNFARHGVGLAPLGEAAILDDSAAHKSADIIRCDSFSHEACGRRFTYWMQRFGYIPSGCWRVGENIAWGTGSYATVRSIFSAWMHSPGHRANILGRYRQIGIGLRVGGLDGYAGAHVWTQEFGLRC